MSSLLDIDKWTRQKDETRFENEKQCLRKTKE